MGYRKEDGYNDDGFVRVPLSSIRDDRLSFKALGLITYLASHVEGFPLSREFIIGSHKDGREAVETGLRELRELGYLTVEQSRDAETGQLTGGSDYVLHRVPVTVTLKTRTTGTVTPETRKTGNPDTGKPATKVDQETNRSSKSYDANASSSSGADAPTQDLPRPDVDQLCTTLAELIVDGGSKPPTITKAWRTAARLLLDRDGPDGKGVELAKALNLVRWCQADEFWRSNILSMPKFREQYDRLRIKAMAEWAETHGKTDTPTRATGGRAHDPNGKPITDDDYDTGFTRKAEGQ